MKKIQNLINEQSARGLSSFMEYICYILIAFLIFGVVLSTIGRMTFILHTHGGTYDYAIYSETDREWTFRGPTASINDSIRVIANYDGEQEIDLITHIGLPLCMPSMLFRLLLVFGF